MSSSEVLIPFFFKSKLNWCRCFKCRVQQVFRKLLDLRRFCKAQYTGCSKIFEIYLVIQHRNYVEWWVVSKIYVNWVWTWFHFSSFAWNAKSMNDNFLSDSSEKRVNFSVISSAIAEITWYRYKREFTT